MNEIPEKFQITPAQVKDFMDSLSNWRRWGKDDQLGCLNHITPEKRVSAAALVREGITVSAAAPLPTAAAADNPEPVRHLGKRLQDFTRLYVAVAVRSAHVCRYRVDDDKPNASNLFRFGFQQINVSL